MLSKNLSPIFRCYPRHVCREPRLFVKCQSCFTFHSSFRCYNRSTKCRTANNTVKSSTGSSLTHAAPQVPLFPLPAPVKRRKVQLVLYSTTPESTTKVLQSQDLPNTCNLIRPMSAISAPVCLLHDSITVDGRSQPFPRNLRSFLFCPSLYNSPIYPQDKADFPAA